MGFEVFADGGDLVVEEVHQGIAEFLRGGDEVFSFCGVGEFLDNAREFFASARAFLLVSFRSLW